ncbi:MAG: DUF6188 family protein [Terriglobales bacterium]
MAGLAVAPSDRYEIPILSRSVSRLYVQSGFDIQFVDKGEVPTIRIADPIAVVTENSNLLARSTRPLEQRSFGRIVVRGSAMRAGSALEIVFDPDVWFWVEAEHTSEADAWGPYGSRGLMLVCMPGREMAIWFGRKRSRLTDEPANW